MLSSTTGGHRLRPPISRRTGDQNHEVQAKSSWILGNDGPPRCRIPGRRRRGAGLGPGSARSHGRARLPGLRAHHPGRLEGPQRSCVAGSAAPAPERVGLCRHLLRLDWRRRVPRLLRRSPRKNRDSARSPPRRRRVLGSSPAIARLEVGLDAAEHPPSGPYARAPRSERAKGQPMRRNPMTILDPAESPPSLARAIAQRTRGRPQAHATRLMSPSDFGEILKPFVFLDLIDHEGAPFDGGLHPHSGIATLSYVVEGAVSYIDPDNVKGTLPAFGVEWMQAGRGMWHGGGLDQAGRTRGVQLWIALPPQLELGPTVSIYQSPQEVPEDGPARVLLGSSGDASSAIESPSPINYLAVRLKTGERWRYQPPAGHTVLWVAIGRGAVSTPDELHE